MDINLLNLQIGDIVVFKNKTSAIVENFYYDYDEYNKEKDCIRIYFDKEVLGKKPFSIRDNWFYRLNGKWYKDYEIAHYSNDIIKIIPNKDT